MNTVRRLKRTENKAMIRFILLNWVVRMERLELSQDNLLEPKSSASTSSATFAFCMNAALYLLIGYLTSYKFKSAQSDAHRYIKILLKLKQDLGNTPTRDGVCRPAPNVLMLLLSLNPTRNLADGVTYTIRRRVT